jgi:hypothetical protein
MGMNSLITLINTRFMWPTQDGRANTQPYEYKQGNTPIYWHPYGSKFLSGLSLQLNPMQLVLKQVPASSLASC